MPIVSVQLTDTFDQWRQKTNSMIEKVNTLGSAGDIISVTTPASGHVLVFNGTTFRNVALSGDVTINENGIVTVVGGTSGGMTKGRSRFAGSISGLY